MALALSDNAWLESKIQRKLIDYAATLNIKLIPVAARGRRGFPDLLGFTRNRKTDKTRGFLIEVKKVGGRLSPVQSVFHRELLPFIEVITVYCYSEAVRVVYQIYKDAQ
jgi:hypothetical protein